MPFFVFDSYTGADVPTAPEQLLGHRWGESTLRGKVRLVVFSFMLTVIGLVVAVSLYLVYGSYVAWLTSADPFQRTIVTASWRPWERVVLHRARCPARTPHVA